KYRLFLAGATVLAIPALVGVSMLVPPAEPAHAATRTAASCNQTDVQNAINQAVDGDTVQIPAGTCTWASTDVVVWENKNVSVIGAGIDQTIIHPAAKVFYVSIKDPSKGHFRISGMTFTGSPVDAQIIITQSTLAVPVMGWRIDHMKFDISYSQIGADS